MDAHEREAGDVRRLKRLIRNTTRAKQQDRYRMALLAIEGRQKLEINELLGVAKSAAGTWAYRYRDGGIEALTPRKSPGAKPKRSGEGLERFKTRMGAERPSCSGLSRSGRWRMRWAAARHRAAGVHARARRITTAGHRTSVAGGVRGWFMNRRSGGVGRSRDDRSMRGIVSCVGSRQECCARWIFRPRWSMHRPSRISRRIRRRGDPTVLDALQRPHQPPAARSFG
jgi:transposase